MRRKEVQLSIMLLSIVLWLYCAIIIPNDIKLEARETRRLCIELATAQAVSRSKGPLHTYAVNVDDRLFVTNVVDDGKVVWERGKTEAR